MTTFQELQDRAEAQGFTTHFIDGNQTSLYVGLREGEPMWRATWVSTGGGRARIMFLDHDNDLPEQIGKLISD